MPGILESIEFQDTTARSELLAWMFATRDAVDDIECRLDNYEADTSTGNLNDLLAALDDEYPLLATVIREAQ